jgi:hypothetical protein
MGRPGNLPSTAAKGKVFCVAMMSMGKSYRVVGGQVPGLILNDEEIQWLRQAWAEAIRK